VNPFTIDELKRLNSGYELKISWKKGSRSFSKKLRTAVNSGQSITYSGYAPESDLFCFSDGDNLFKITPEDVEEYLSITWFTEEKTTEFSELCKKIRDKYKK